VSVRGADVVDLAPRTYDDEEPLTARHLELLGLTPGLNPNPRAVQRAYDRAETREHAAMLEAKEARHRVEHLARGQVRARRAADAAYRAWRAPWGRPTDADDFWAARRRADLLREELREVLLFDDALVADVMRRAAR
jgi:hypothetical protein